MSRAGTRMRLIIAALMGLASASGLAAQDWRTVAASHLTTGEPMRAEVRYSAGFLRLGAGDAGRAYALTVRYDEERFDLVNEFTDQRLRVGVSGSVRGLGSLKLDDDAGELDLRLDPDTPLYLDIEFGAGKGDIDLGGLNLTNLKLTTGATETRVSVSAPTARAFAQAEFEVGAADFEARQLGNLRAHRLEIAAGVGDVRLDFSGAGDTGQTPMEVRVSLGIGALELRIPTDVGVRIERDAFLTSMDLPDMNERDGAWYSENWDSAARRIDFEIEAAFGDVELVWLR